MIPWLRDGARILISMLVLAQPAPPSFIDHFNSVKLDPEGMRGWRFATGDGAATMRLKVGGAGYASVLVDATGDRRGIWWALLERAASGLDVGLLGQPGHEVRIETRLRVSHAPRRVNLQVLTQRTTDFHSFLMEFDIPDTGRWHTISMTTRGFRTEPGDTLIGHLALMDWGLEKYQVDLDYFKIEIVEPARASPDQGASVPYHPPVADPRSFAQVVAVAHDSMIDRDNPDMNLNDWSVREGEAEGTKTSHLLTVDGTHDVILRWQLDAWAGRQVAGHGLLELTTQAISRKGTPVKDFGLLRVVEILGGDPGWDQRTVTSDSLRRGQPLHRVLNPQMIIDWAASEVSGGKTHLTISRSVLQRLIDGKTRGIAVRALGALSASFYASENDGGKQAPRLLFNLEPRRPEQKIGQGETEPRSRNTPAP